MPRRDRATEDPDLDLPVNASAREILEKFFPLVIKVATDSASALTATATTIASLEKSIDELRTKVEHLEKAVGGRASNTKAWLGILKSVLTPANVAQMLVIIASALALWTQIPDVPEGLLLEQGREIEAAGRRGTPIQSPEP
jgi:hypothetical protein